MEKEIPSLLFSEIEHWKREASFWRSQYSRAMEILFDSENISSYGKISLIDEFNKDLL